MESLKKLLAGEAQYQLPDEVLDRLLGMMTEIRLKTDDPLVAYGSLNTDIYILKEGILRLIYFDGENERTYAFALAGTMVMSLHAYYMRRPAFMQVEACTESTVLKISKERFDRLMEESHEFALWVASASMQQLYFLEMKQSVINGTAKERFMGLINNRPEIMEKVRQGIIASYLGVTQSYLSRLKKQLLSSNSGR